MWIWKYSILRNQYPNCFSLVIDFGKIINQHCEIMPPISTILFLFFQARKKQREFELETLHDSMFGWCYDDGSFIVYLSLLYCTVFLKFRKKIMRKANSLCTWNYIQSSFWKLTSIKIYQIKFALLFVIHDFLSIRSEVNCKYSWSVNNSGYGDSLETIGTFEEISRGFLKL